MTNHEFIDLTSDQMRALLAQLAGEVKDLRVQVRQADQRGDDALRERHAATDALLKARGALSNLMLEPHGCSLCDSGVPRNNFKGHQPDCPYVRAVEAMDAADLVLTPNVGVEAPLTARRKDEDGTD